MTPSFGGGSLLGPILWTVGSDYLTADNKPGFTTPEVKQSFAKMRELFLSQVDLARRAHRLVGSLLVHPGPRGHAVVRAVGDAGHPEGHR